MEYRSSTEGGKGDNFCGRGTISASGLVRGGQFPLADYVRGTESAPTPALDVWRP